MNASPTVAEVNGVVRVSAPQQAPQRPVFPASTGPGPPPATGGPPPPGPPPSPAAATAQGSAAKPEQAKGAAVVVQPQQQVVGEERSTSPPPPKKFKSEPKVSFCLLLFCMDIFSLYSSDESFVL